MAIRILALVIFIVLITLTAFGVWNLYAAQLRAQESMRAKSTFSTVQPSIDMHNLFADYTSLVILHVTNLYDGKETLSTKAQLSSTIQKMADELSTVGEKETRQDFSNIFQKHIEEYENYTVGLKENDISKMDAAKKQLAKDAHNLGILYGGGEDLMNQHTALILAILNTHAQKDIEKKQLLIRDANLQASVFADELVSFNQEKQHL